MELVWDLLTQEGGQEPEVLGAWPYHDFSHLCFRPARDVVPLPPAAWGREKSHKRWNTHEWDLLGAAEQLCKGLWSPSPGAGAFWNETHRNIFFKCAAFSSTTP